MNAKATRVAGGASNAASLASGPASAGAAASLASLASRIPESVARVDESTTASRPASVASDASLASVTGFEDVSEVASTAVAPSMDPSSEGKEESPAGNEASGFAATSCLEVHASPQTQSDASADADPAQSHLAARRVIIEQPSPAEAMGLAQDHVTRPPRPRGADRRWWGTVERLQERKKTGRSGEKEARTGVPSRSTLLVSSS